MTTDEMLTKKTRKMRRWKMTKTWKITLYQSKY